MASSIAVHSFKGGTGKTTITANLAVALVSHGKSVGVMDMDLEGPGLHVLFNVNPDQITYTLNDVLLDKARAEEAALPMNDRLGLKGGGMLYFSPASTKMEEMLRTLRTGFEVESFSKALLNLEAHFNLDYLLIDTHPGLRMTHYSQWACVTISSSFQDWTSRTSLEPVYWSRLPVAWENLPILSLT